MAATMHAKKINRMNMYKLNLIRIREEILDPSIPMALRLSGILMVFLGGVVIVYERKVKLLYDINEMKQHCGKIEDRRCLLESWHKTLNDMTWTEILRQVLVVAGFGSKAGTRNRNAINKEVNIMEKYGLSPGMLKGGLFSALLTKGNNRMKVHELSKLSSIAELNLAATTKEVEYFISSTLSSDITLFEKISASAYRLRVNASIGF